MPSLLSQRSRPLPPGTPALDSATIAELSKEVPGWKLEGNQLVRTFEFENFHQTMEFVNALAWVVHREDHHPDLEVSYSRCKVSFWTHTVGGVSQNDFICAAKIDALFG
jgi:4a-hydroxytetrahydrobiopterin dehydratase